MWLEVTNSCNLKCAHCYADSGPWADRSNELNVEQWKSVIRELISNGCEIITFIGGEPLVRSDMLSSLIPFARELDSEIRLRVFSNLTHSSRLESLIPTLVKCNVHFGTSLYGLNESDHDAMTKIKGSWIRTINSIEILRKNNINVFAGFYKNDREQIGNHKITAWAESLGINSIEVLAPSQVGRGALIDWKSTSQHSNILPQNKSYAYRSIVENINSHNCFADHFTIKPTGEVSPCIMQRNSSYGNIVDGLSAILEYKQREDMMNLTKDNIEGCKDCEFRYGCFDCRPDAVGKTGNLAAKPNCGYNPYADV